MVLGVWFLGHVGIPIHPEKCARPSWNVICTQSVYLYNCPPFEATRAWYELALESIYVKTVGKVTICIVVQELYKLLQGYIVNTVYRVHNIVQLAAL